MDRTRKRTVAIGAAVALAAAGGGVAYAAATSGGTSQRDAFLRDAAQRLNVTPDQLGSALQGAFVDRLQQAVKDGKLTQQQADRIAQRVKDGGLPFGGPGGPGPGFPGPGLRHGGMLVGPGPGAIGVELDAAASYLGLPSADLLRDLRSGRSLAGVASAQGKSVDGLEQALLDAARARLDRAVADGKLTSAQRDRIYRALQQHVADLVNGSGPRPPLRRMWRGGPDGPGMPPWGPRHP